MPASQVSLSASDPRFRSRKGVPGLVGRTEPLLNSGFEGLAIAFAVLADAGSAGIDGNELSRKTQKVDRKKRIDILAHLEEAGMVRIMEVPKPEGMRGRVKRIYFDIA